LICRASRTSFHLIGALDRDVLGNAPTPSCLVHWIAMRDLFRDGVREYNLGTRSGSVYAFKRKFRPEERSITPPISLICSPAKFRLCSTDHIHHSAAPEKQVESPPESGPPRVEFLRLRLDFGASHQPTIWHVQTPQRRSHYCCKARL
jgi:hypothetical protein